MVNQDKKHWLVVLVASLMMSSAFGINININGIFLAPLAEKLNQPMAEISLFVTLMSMGMAFASFVITPILERYKYKHIILIATIVAVASFVLMGFTTNIYMLYLFAIIRGVAAAFFGPMPSQYLINNWFKEKHGLATSIVFSAAGLVGAIASPVVSYIIQEWGVEVAFIVSALTILAMNSMAIFYNYTYYPSDSGLLPYGAEKEDLKEVEFTPEEQGKEDAVYVNYKSYPFTAIIILGIIIPGLTALVQHLSPMAVNFGYTVELGALLISSSMIANIFSKLAIGIIADNRGIIAGKLVMLFAMAIGLIFLILHWNPFLMLIGSFGLGCVYALASVGMSLLTKRFYEGKAFGKVYPIVSFIGNLGSAFAISLYGLSFDITNSYMLALWISLALTLIAALILISLDRILKRQ